MDEYTKAEVEEWECQVYSRIDTKFGNENDFEEEESVNVESEFIRIQ